MDAKYTEQLTASLRELEAIDTKRGGKLTRAAIERNTLEGAPSNAEELALAASAAACGDICARCGQALSAKPNRSRYVALPVCDLCAMQEAALECMNNPLPFRLWHCCVVSSAEEAAPSQPVLWHCKGLHGADAIGIFEDGGITVLKGSRVADCMTSDFAARVESKARILLFEDMTIDSDFRFTRDMHFNSPSAAGKIVLGRTSNGWVAWKNDNGEPLDTMRNK